MSKWLPGTGFFNLFPTELASKTLQVTLSKKYL